LCLFSHRPSVSRAVPEDSVQVMAPITSLSEKAQIITEVPRCPTRQLATIPESFLSLKGFASATGAIALEANKRYAFEQRVLIVSDSVTPDFKYSFTIPADATIKIDNEDWNSNTARNSIDGTTVIPFIPLSTDERYIQIHGHVETSSTAGNLQFQCSQNTSHADKVTVKTGSSLRVYEAGS